MKSYFIRVRMENYSPHSGAKYSVRFAGKPPPSLYKRDANNAQAAVNAATSAGFMLGVTVGILDTYSQSRNIPPNK